MSWHRWIYRDADPGYIELQCIGCGIAIGTPDDLEDTAMYLLPDCGGPAESTKHHFTIVPHVSLEAGHWQLECDFCGAAADEPRFGPGEYDPQCRSEQ